MFRSWSTVDDEELKGLRRQAHLLRQAIIVGARWTGKYSPEWDRLVEIATESGIPGLVEQLEAIKRHDDEWRTLHSGDP